MAGVTGTASQWRLIGALLVALGVVTSIALVSECIHDCRVGMGTSCSPTPSHLLYISSQRFACCATRSPKILWNATRLPGRPPPGRPPPATSTFPSTVSRAVHRAQPMYRNKSAGGLLVSSSESLHVPPTARTRRCPHRLACRCHIW